jgi:DNA segregation ATPase FtsK/SpoIIIE, S-DNA-T family
MTGPAITKATVPGNPPIAEDPQRKQLQQLTILCFECARDEQKIETDHEQQLADHEQRIAYVRAQNEEKREKNLAAIDKRRDETLDHIQRRYASDSDTLEQKTREARQNIENSRLATDEQIKKKTEQARWLAESVLEAIQTQVDIESRQAKQQHATHNAEVDHLADSLDATRVRLEQAPVPFEPLAGEEMSRQIDEMPDSVYKEYLARATERLERLETLRLPRFVAGGTPYLVGILLCPAVAIGVGFVMPPGRPMWIGVTAAAVVSIIGCILAALQLRRRARTQFVSVCIPLLQSLDLARRANEAAFTRGEAQRKQREYEERKKCAIEVDTAREKARPLQVQAVETRARLLAELEDGYVHASRQLAQSRTDRTAEANQLHNSATEAAEHAYAHEKARIDSDDQSGSSRIQHEYEQRSKDLHDRWDGGLKTLARLLADADHTPPAPLTWAPEAWENWRSPKEFAPSIPFGTLQVDLRALTTHVPQRLELPDAITIPAVLAFPQRGSMLIETDHASRPQAINIASLVVARLLTHLPAGRAKLTIIDPVGLGQSFAGFMHLADHDESLVGGRIWTENEHIEQRLADLTEHMETVIQKYLRNEYETIDQYNAQAGELAEPVRFLVIADFPTAFETESLRRLASIATSGARCGVYMIIIRDTRQQLPQGSRYEELVSRSIYLRIKEGRTSWIDEVFARFPLTLDPPPGEKTLTMIMDRVGLAAREAKRVEVPFDTIAPGAGRLWTASSRDELKIAIGKSGATRLQSLRLGVGVAQHSLIAGKTGSGKSNLMHTIVTNMAMWYSPDEVEFYLVDFKKGVEFKAYVTRRLPHARAIAVESDREFGLSVLQRVDAELTRRGELFRAAGVQEISAYRQNTRQRLPRTLLLIDEFQEFFSEDDKLGQEAAVLLDRLVRQGRAFGVHVVLGSQTIGGSSGLARSTLGQMAVRIALQCSETDSQLILGDNNSAARLLSRPGEAVYNDAGGLVESNSPFQIAFLPDEQRERYLELVDQQTRTTGIEIAPSVVFEGNAPADIRKNARLMALLQSPKRPAPSHAVLGWMGEPVSIKEPTAAIFRPQSGANLLLVGQQDELAISIMCSVLISLAAQYASDAARTVILDGTPADSLLSGTLARTAEALPLASQNVAYRDVDSSLAELSEELDRRMSDSSERHDAIFLFVCAIQRYRALRHQEESFSFSSEEKKPQPDKQLARLITEGPSVGIHVIAWADTAVTLDRTFERGVLREFDSRVLFQMSATDSSNLIDSPAANKLGQFRALSYSEEQGTAEKFRPYEIPSAALLEEVRIALKTR